MYNKKPVILFRRCFDINSIGIQEEYDIASEYFQVFECRNSIPTNSLVIGRYSVLPYYKELMYDLHVCCSMLINSYESHQYIADILQYVQDIGDYTPKTFTRWGDLSCGKWVVKGRTNSRKFQWDEMMFADGREALLGVIGKLMADPFISEQGLVVREYIPLEQIGVGLHGLPISKEWRCFFYKDQLLASGFYWSSYADIFNESLPSDGIAFVNKIAKIVSKNCNFFVIDVAKTESGDYIVVELNDGCMSGLSMVDPHELYSNLQNCLTNSI